MERHIDAQQLQELLDQGLSERTIARELDVPRTTLKRHIDRLRGTPIVHKGVQTPEALTAVQEDLVELAAWWRERKRLAQAPLRSEEETQRQTYHVQKRFIEAIKREAELERVSITEIVNRAFQQFFAASK